MKAHFNYAPGGVQLVIESDGFVELYVSKLFASESDLIAELSAKIETEEEQKAKQEKLGL